MISQMFDMAQALETTLITQRRDFHRYPELGWCELRTSSIIARKLTDLKFDEVLTGRDVCDADSRMGASAPSAQTQKAQSLPRPGRTAAFPSACAVPRCSVCVPEKTLTPPETRKGADSIRRPPDHREVSRSFLYLRILRRKAGSHFSP